MSSVSESLPGLQLLMRELERCGWKPAPTGLIDGGFYFQTPAGGAQIVTHLFRPERGEPLLVVDFEDIPLAGQDELFPRFLDFPLEVRMVLGAARVLSTAGYVLILSRNRFELYRLPDETREYSVSTLRAFEDELLPALAAKARARGDNMRSFYNPMEGADSLRGWIQHWSRQISAQIEISIPDCEKFLWKLIIMLQVSRKVGKSEILGGWGLRCEQAESVWSLGYDPVNTHAELARLLDEFDGSISSRIFSGDAEMHKQWLAAMDESTLAEQFRAEMLMHSQAKFEAETAAWLFTRVEREQEGWKHEIAGVPPVRKRLHSQGWAVLQPIVCDVSKYGLMTALREADRLAQHWHEYELFMRRDEAGHGELFSQPDFFFNSPRGVNQRNQLEDPINFILSSSLRLKGVEPHEEFGAGLVVLLKFLSFISRYDWQFHGIDALDCLWTGEGK